MLLQIHDVHVETLMVSIKVSQTIHNPGYKYQSEQFNTKFLHGQCQFKLLSQINYYSKPLTESDETVYRISSKSLSSSQDSKPGPPDY